MADDMRHDELKWMPTVRQLIGDRGVTFTNSFAPYPLCCPSRASFMKGQYAHNHGVLGNLNAFGFRSFKDRSTIATDLRRSGYATVFLGKYLNGYGVQRAPDGSGGGRMCRRDGRLGWGRPRGPSGRLLSGSPYHYRKTTLKVNGTLVPHRGRSQTKVFGGLSGAWVRRRAAASKPFFFWASYVAPHFGQPTERDDLGRTPARWQRAWSATSSTIRSRARWTQTRPMSQADKPQFIQSLSPFGPERIAAIIEHYNKEPKPFVWITVAKTMAALRRTGELSNTFVIFTSDNGYLLPENTESEGRSCPMRSPFESPS